MSSAQHYSYYPHFTDEKAKEQRGYGNVQFTFLLTVSEGAYFPAPYLILGVTALLILCWYEK